MPLRVGAWKQEEEAAPSEVHAEDQEEEEQAGPSDPAARKARKDRRGSTGLTDRDYAMNEEDLEGQIKQAKRDSVYGGSMGAGPSNPAAKKPKKGGDGGSSSRAVEITETEESE